MKIELIAAQKPAEGASAKILENVSESMVLLSAMFVNINWYINGPWSRDENCVYMPVSLGHANQRINHFKDKNCVRLRKCATAPNGI